MCTNCRGFHYILRKYSAIGLPLPSISSPQSHCIANTDVSKEWIYNSSKLIFIVYEHEPSCVPLNCACTKCLNEDYLGFYGVLLTDLINVVHYLHIKHFSASATNFLKSRALVIFLSAQEAFANNFFFSGLEKGRLSRALRNPHGETDTRKYPHHLKKYFLFILFLFISL